MHDQRCVSTAATSPGLTAELRRAATLPPERAAAWLGGLAALVQEVPLAVPIGLVAGCDVAYPADRRTAACAAVALWSVAEGRVVETAIARGLPAYPYVPTLFALREAPLILAAFAALAGRPDLVLCEGHGRAHPRRCGLACVVGLALDLPTAGCARSPLGSHVAVPHRERGASAPVLDHGEVVGMALRTRRHVRPVVVSVGHRITLNEASEWVLRLSRTRIPEPLRVAHTAAAGGLGPRGGR